MISGPRLTNFNGLWIKLDAIRPIGPCAITLPRCGVEMKIIRATSRCSLKINASLIKALLSGERLVCAGDLPKK